MAASYSIDGAVLRELREARMWSQVKLTAKAQAAAKALEEWSGFSRNALSLLENGNRTAVGPATLSYLVAALAPLPDEDLRRLLQGAEPPARLATLARYGPVPEEGVSLHRRDAAAAIIAAPLVPFVDPEALERFADARWWPVDEGLVAAHECTAADFVRMHRVRDPRVLLPGVAAHADQVAVLLNRSMTDAHRARVSAVAAQAQTHAGVLAFNAADLAAAQRHFALARAIADDSGDLALHAHVLGEASILYSPLPRGGQGGDHKHTLKLIRQARSLAHGHADGATQGWLAVWEADETTLDRDLDIGAIHRLLDVAERHLDGAGDMPWGFLSGAGLYGRVENYVQRVRAQAIGLDGNHDEAVETLDGLARSAATIVWQVIVTTRIGAVLLDADEPEGACAEFGKAVRRSRAAGYMMGVQRVLGVRSRFPERFANLACTRKLDALLRRP